MNSDAPMLDPRYDQQMRMGLLSAAPAPLDMSERFQVHPVPVLRSGGAGPYPIPNEASQNSIDIPAVMHGEALGVEQAS